MTAPFMRGGVKRGQILALDLGGSAFKLAVLRRTDSGHETMQTKLLELTPSPEAADRPAVLRKLLEGVSVKSFSHVVSVVDDPFACLRQVLVPPMPAGEMQGAVRWELQRFLAVPPEETVVDSQVLEETQVEGAQRMKLLAAAIPEGAIREHLAFLSQAGVRPTQLIPPAPAVAAWLGRAGQAVAPVGALLMGERSCEFLVAQSGRLLFARKIPVNGREITRGMTGVLMTAQGQVGLSEQEAEEVKRKVGIPAAGSSEPVTRGISETQILSLLLGTLDRLAMELERSLASFGETSGSAAVQELFLVGGAAQMKGLAGWLKERLNLEVRVPEDGTALVPALGAGMGAGSGLNLLPLDLRQVTQVKVKRATVTGILTAFLAGMLLFRVGIGVYGRSLRAQIAALQVEQKALEPELAQARVGLAAQRRQQQEPRWEELFKEMSHAVPKEAYLTQWVVNERQVIFRGRIRPTGRPADAVLSDFMRILGEGFFDQVQLASTRQTEGGAREAEFEIRCLIR